MTNKSETPSEQEFVNFSSKRHLGIKVKWTADGVRYSARVLVLTPTDGQVYVEILPLTEHRDDQQAVQVDALNQQPIVVGHYAVLHHHHGTTAPRHSLTQDN